MDFTPRDDNVLHDFPPFLRVYKDGRVKRFMLTENVPPGTDPVTGAQCKDVIISNEPKIHARIFIPTMDPAKPKKLPLLVHYHGGGFCIGSSMGPITRQFLTNYVSLANVVAITIDYRLAPEHPLPIAYDDSWAGLQWVAGHAQGNGPEPWLNEFVDFGKVYLGGDSAGANIAHDVAIRASVNPLDGLKMVGLWLVHPYFAQKEPDRLIQYLYPTSSGADDDPRLNPGVDPILAQLACEKVLVCVAEKDSLKNRGMAYYKSLVQSGWGGKAEFVETEGEGHCFHLFNPSSPRAGPLIDKLTSFVSGD